MDDDARSYGTLEPSSREPLLPATAARQHRCRNVQCTICWSILVILLIFALWGTIEVLIQLYLMNDWSPFPVFRDPPPLQPDYGNETFAVGFDLSAGYGTAAISYYDGTFVDVGRVDGDERYNEMMAVLSLESSRHPTSPYYGRGQRQDIPRQLRRKLRKWHGRPASDEAAAMITVLSPLVNQANARLVSQGHLDGRGIHGQGKLRYAQLTVLHLPAVYNEDLSDAADHLGIQIMMPWGFKTGDAAQWPLTEVNTAYAGMSLGLCRDWRPRQPCEGKIPNIMETRSLNVLSVSFTQQALTVHVSPLSSATGSFYSAGAANFTAGLVHRSSYSDADAYWRLVRKAIRDVLDGLSRGSMVDVVAGFGEHAEHKRLQEILREEIRGRGADGGDIQWFVSNDVYAAAKGAAELIKRCMRVSSLQGNGFMNCIPDLRPKIQGW